MAMREELNNGYRKLWREDRLKARVLYLKLVEERTSLEIVQILGITSESNVDQLFSRARRRMRELIEESRQVQHSTKQENVERKKEIRVPQNREAVYEMS